MNQQTLVGIKSILNPFRGLSMERLRDEFDKILLSSAPVKAIKLMDELGLLKTLLPEITAMKGIEQPKEFHPEGDVFTHTMLGIEISVNEIKDRDLVLMWAVLLHDVGKPVTITYPEDVTKDRIRFNNHDVEGSIIAKEILLRFKHPNKLIEAVCYIIRNHIRIGTAMKMRRGKLKLMMSGSNFANELNLQKIDCLSSHGELDIYNFLVSEYDQFKQEKQLPNRIVTGYFLKELGYNPSPLFAEIIEQCYELQLEGFFKNIDEIKDFIGKKWLKA